MSTASHDNSYDVEVENTEMPVKLSEARHEQGCVDANIGARQMVVASLEQKRDRDILFPNPPSSAPWREADDF